MHPLLQILVMVAVVYWSTTLRQPFDHARWEPVRVPGRLASEPPDEPLDDGDDGDHEDAAAMQPSIERVFRSPSPVRQSDEAPGLNEPVIRASASGASRASTSTSRRGVGLSTPSTSKRTRGSSSVSAAPVTSPHSVRWATPLESSDSPASRPVIDHAGARPAPLPRGSRATLTESSHGTSLVFQPSSGQASSSSSRTKVVPSTSRSATPTPSSSRASRMTSGPSASRSSSTAPTTSASSASHSGGIMTRRMSLEGGTSGPRVRVSPSSVSTASVASSVLSANRRILDVYDRQFVWFKNCTDTMLENGMPAGTAWFESESNSEISQPPNFSACKDVRVGDIFCHRTPTVCQLWMWTQPADNRLPCWTSVQLGFRRSDGRKLIVTKSRRRPSWVL